jgi:hypothetical protein
MTAIVVGAFCLLSGCLCGYRYGLGTRKTRQREMWNRLELFRRNGREN